MVKPATDCAKTWGKAMRSLCVAILFVFTLAFVAGSAFGTPGTLWQQEGGPNDQDVTEVSPLTNGHPYSDAADNWTNWKHQYGSASWSGVYAGDTGWLNEAESGDSDLDIEADIEMYCSETIADNKVYFHVGNVYSATTADLTAYVTGTMASNNGQWIGLSFEGQGKSESDFEKVGGNLTGKIIGGMVSTHDTWRPQSNSMDVEMKLFVNGVSTDWESPGSYGDGAHNTIHDSLWWLVNNGIPGSYAYSYRIRLLPTANQPDGDYYLDPVLVVAPTL